MKSLFVQSIKKRARMLSEDEISQVSGGHTGCKVTFVLKPDGGTEVSADGDGC